MKRALIALVVGVIASGCSVMPWPHSANVTPKVRGSIEHGGKPLPNIPVRVAAGAKDDVCAGRLAEASTGPDGLFVVEPATEFRFFVVVMAHTFFPWSFCYGDGRQWTALLTKKEYALVDSGPVGVQVVRCDLSRPMDQRCEVTWGKE